MSHDLNPKKYFNKDLIDKPLNMHVWLQGTIEEELKDNVFIISDSTGKVKVVNCESADGIIDRSSLKTGTYCCVLGIVTKTEGLPVVHARKIVDLSSQPLMKSVWEIEVQEADLVLQGKLVPDIETT